MAKSKVKIAITGSNGFIGKNIFKKFEDENEMLPLKIREISDVNVIEEKILNFRPDVFIHCGWWGGNSIKDVNNKEQLKNVVIGRKLFKILSRLDHLNFVGLGSFAEYGNYEIPIKETFLENPTSLYGVSKKRFKDFSKLQCMKNKFNWLWIRPCFIYGPGDRDTRFIPRIISSCITQDNEQRFNSCDSIIDYLYIEDFLNAIKVLLDGNYQGVFNICSGKQYKSKHVINRIKNMCNSETNFVFDKNMDDENSNKYICGDNSKLIKKTGWKVHNTLNSGLIKTIESIRNER